MITRPTLLRHSTQLLDLDDLLNIDNPYFEGMVNQIYPPELQLNGNQLNVCTTSVTEVEVGPVKLVIHY